MALQPAGYNGDEATNYHYGQFPPNNLDYQRILRPHGAATAALARYDELLRNMHNKELLLAPLRSKEAVISSRIEGTVATLEEVLRIEADAEGGEPDSRDNSRLEALEVYSYSRAMKFAQGQMESGLPICSRLIRDMHARLMILGRGADMSPGRFKIDQNYIVDQVRRKVLFVPITPDKLNDGMTAFENFINEVDADHLIQTALAHLEFEALHPFKDGNGRVGRMLIPLNLWDKRKISGPHFYISRYLEENRDEYLERLRRTSANGEWTEWVIFFLEAIEAQAKQNIEVAERVRQLYEEMKTTFQRILASQWIVVALDYVFEKPIFRNSAFTATSGIPTQTAHRLTKSLSEKGLLSVIEPASGRRAALYAFTPLLEVVRS